MNRIIVVPTLLFLASCLLCLVASPAIPVSFVIGVALCVAAFVRKKRLINSTKEQATDRLLTRDSLTLAMRSGLALVLAPLVIVLFVFAGMTGFFRPK